MTEMTYNFVRSGYSRDNLKRIEAKAFAKFSSNNRNKDEKPTITFPIFHFEEINSFKKIIFDAKIDLQKAIGDTKIIMAVKKNPSIGNSVVRNKQLSIIETIKQNQSCQASNCLQCPLVNTNNNIYVNNKQVKPQKTLNCKSRNIIYLWQCQICDIDNGYFGRTIQKSHERTNTHRRCFAVESKWEDSALSMHSGAIHPEQMDLRNFKITLVRGCSP